MPETFFVSALGIEPGQLGPILAMALVEPGGLILRIQGKPDLRLAYPGLSLAVDPQHPERVVLKGSGLGEGCVVVDDRRIGDQIAALAPPEFGAQWRALQYTATRRRHARNLLGACAVVLVMAALVGGAWWGYGALINFAVAAIPPRYESKLSENAVVLDKAALNDPLVAAAVDQITGRLLKTLRECPYEFHFVVVPNPVVNAFAMPGGRIVIYTGLIAQTQSPDELAGVLAHEMQHVLRRHTVRGFVRKLGVQGLFAIFFAGHGELGDLLSAYAPGLLGLRFDREQEAEADSGGMEMLFSAGIPGEGMVRFFEKLSKEETGTGRALNFMSDHPTSLRRLQDLESLRQAHPAPPPADWGLDWAAVREHCRLAAKAQGSAAQN
jgi:Zn-dependent protease with chaperone function